jgi:hypothetical protein
VGVGGRPQRPGIERGQQGFAWFTCLVGLIQAEIHKDTRNHDLVTENRELIV